MTRHVNAFTASFSVHLLAIATLLWLSAAAVRESARAVAAGKSTAVASPTLELPHSREAAHTPPIKITAAPATLDVPNETGSTDVRMPNFAFDFAKVKQRAAALFPFLTHELALEPIRQLVATRERSGLVSPFARVVEDTSGKPPLVMSEAAIHALVDKSWSRRERWIPFQAIGALTKQHHPSRGQLPRLLRQYSEQNLLQPYVESHVRDPRLWVMLGIAADHGDFIDFITAYAAEHPSTPATTELLFMLDEMAQGSRDALLTLLTIDPEKDLYWSRQRNEDAHGLIVVLQKHYRARLEQKGIASSEGTAMYFDSVRLAILVAVLQSTPAGYRESDARFLIGSIYWRNGLHQEALNMWRAMAPAPGDRYLVSASATLTAIATPDSVNREAIDNILKAERGRWLDFWWSRLNRFGYALGSF
jgi:hypothetical protein